MAKDITEIVNEMDGIQSSMPTLGNLNSTSSTAIYTLFKYMVALAYVTLYKAWDFAKAEINQIALNQIIGTKAWYVNLALTFSGGTIVQRASCLENGTKVILKVAKQVSGNTSQLTATELANLTSHVLSKKVVGTDISIVSQTADLVALVVSVKFIGSQSVVEAMAKTTIKNYLQYLSFDANLSKSLIENELLQNPLIEDVSVDEMKVDYGFGYQLIASNNATPDAGYFEVGKYLGADLITLNMYQ